MIAVSLAWRPFTEQYARESVAKEYWDSPRFHAVNRRITAMWALAVTVMGIGHLVSGALIGYPAGLVIPADMVLNWVIPFGVIWLTVRYTMRTAHAAHHASSTAGRP